MDESYSYASLLHEGQIRLFKLHISREDEPLMGSMVAVLPDQIPPYKALSYTWGTPYGPEELARLGCSSQKHQTYSVICDWRVLPVTENLYDALVELRSREETAFLWIDAICINQKDESEKSLQVQMMANIYSNAEMVIVWLGKGTPECDEAVKLLMAAGNDDDLLASVGPYTEEQWRLIKTFCARKWFARTWTLQEAILAQRIIGLCGSTEFEFYQIMLLPCLISLLNRSVNPELLSGPRSEGSESGFECIEMILQWTQIWNASGNGLFKERINPMGPFSRRLSLSIHDVGQPKHVFALLDLLVSDMRQREVSDSKDRILAPMAVYLNYVSRLDTQLGEIMKRLINYRSKPLPSLLEGTSFNASNGLGEFEAPSCAIRGKSRDSQTDYDKNGFFRFIHLKLRGVLLGQVLHSQNSQISFPSMWPWFRKFVMSSSQYKNQDYLDVISRTLSADTYMGKCPASDNIQQIFMAFVMVQTAMELQLYLSHAEDASLAAFWETQTEFLEFCKDDFQRQKIAKLVGSETEATTAFQEMIEELFQMSDGKASSAHRLSARWKPQVKLGWHLMRDAISATEKFLFIMGSGYLGLAPKSSEVGDAVWIVQGAKVPFILRPTGKDSFRFVGEAYVHGRMFGEMAEVAKAQDLPIQDILIDESVVFRGAIR